MGNETAPERVQVGTLAELDALIGRFVTGEKPHTHWEDSHAHLRFDSINEALEALREPYFQQFIPKEDRARTVLREIQEFPHYSEDLALAWELVRKLTTTSGSLHISCAGDTWRASFGERPEVSAASAAAAICLAALRARGVEVELTLGAAEGAGADLLDPEAMLNLARSGTLAD